MGQLKGDKWDAIAALMRGLPDDALMTLKLGMSADPAEAWVAPVRHAVEDQLADRRLRDVVLQALAIAAVSHALRDPLIPKSAVAAVWRALHVDAPEAVARAMETQRQGQDGNLEPVSRELCTRAADRLRRRVGAFAECAAALDASSGAEGVAGILALAQILRSAAPRARAWLRTGGADEASYLRLAVRDASALSPEGGPLVIDLLSRCSDAPSAAIRLVSAVMDRPAEVFLATSEFAPFAEQALDEIDGAIQRLKRAADGAGRAHGAALAASVDQSLHLMDELAHAVQLDKEKPWGRRVAAQRRDLALAAERWLKQADGLVAAALPVQASRAGLPTVQGAPTLHASLQPQAVAKAEAALAFLDGVRRAARDGGFGVLHGRVVNALDMRLDTYIDDLLAHMQTDGEASAERLQVAAEFLGMVRDPSAAQIVRRRIAAAA